MNVIPPLLGVYSQSKFVGGKFATDVSIAVIELPSLSINDHVVANKDRIPSLLRYIGFPEKEPTRWKYPLNSVSMSYSHPSYIPFESRQSEPTIKTTQSSDGEYEGDVTDGEIDGDVTDGVVDGE